MTIKSIWLRRIHKWIGLVIGLQFMMWAISGTAMALLDMDEVAGGAAAEAPVPPLPASSTAWPRVQKAVGGQPISRLAIRYLPQGSIYQVATEDGIRLFSATDGTRVAIGRATAIAVARSAHPEDAGVSAAFPLSELNFAVRDHQLPIWQVNFADSGNTSYFVSGSTGELLERRNDMWRWWDFFWMLHIMDYSERTNFNHPLIITVGFAMAWLAVTGFWLLFRTMWRHDFTWLKQAHRTGGTRTSNASAKPN